MPGRKAKFYSSNVDVKGKGLVESKKDDKEAEIKPSFADLPLCLIEVILYQLVLKDNILASAVCKTWREAAVFIRWVDRPPWLMYLPKRGNSFELYDPLQQKMYTLNLPELSKSTLINLPKLELAYDAIAFSCAPTSGTCLLLAFKHVKDAFLTTTSTCYLGATDWTTENLDFYRGFGSNSLKHSNVVYAKQRFNCLDGKGRLYFFEPSTRVWHYDTTSLPDCPYISYRFWQYEKKKKRIFLAVRKGEFFKMFTCGGEKPIVYKLDSESWDEINSSTLNGVTIFASLYSSETRMNLPWMRNSVYFPRLRYSSKCCVSYSIDEGRYYPRKQWQEQEDLCPVENLWIRPPKKASDYM
ncbi:hypothetical protein AALP_AA6G183500 [Arabis alpina]|uniref:Uncharacterized protein n=1 Tax=Arabis alpina TaxID=50452 RepID=A0A087GQ19_ARAAL|nr:hypothetical protein AALP_AA6G183500 [Arabis alpina]